MQDDSTAAWEVLNDEILALYQQRQDGQSPEIIQKALQLVGQVWGQGHPDVVAAVEERSTLYSSLGLYGLAEALFRWMLATQEETYGPNHLEVARSLDNLAWMYHDQQQYIQAEHCYRRALVIREKALGADHHALARGLNNLANLYQAQGLSDQARPLYFRLIKLCCDINAGNSEGVAALRELTWHLIMEKLEGMEPVTGESPTPALSVSRG